MPRCSDRIVRCLAPPSAGFGPTLRALCIVTFALLACDIPDPDGGPPKVDDSSSHHHDATPSGDTVTKIEALAAKIDTQVGSGSMRVAECHNENGMGSKVVGHEVNGKLVKIVRRTELAPPTISTAYYFGENGLILARTDISELIEGAPPPPDRRFYRAGRLLKRIGKTANDDEPDAKQQRDDVAVSTALLAGLRDREEDIRLPADVW